MPTVDMESFNWLREKLEDGFDVRDKEIGSIYERVGRIERKLAVVSHFLGLILMHQYPDEREKFINLLAEAENEKEEFPAMPMEMIAGLEFSSNEAGRVSVRYYPDKGVVKVWVVQFNEPEGFYESPKMIGWEGIESSVDNFCRSYPGLAAELRVWISKLCR